VLVPVGLLPVGISLSNPPAADGWPTLWLIGLMVSSVGAPFLVLSTTAPLLQRWFAARRHTVGDPYSLYVASNAGSLAALLGYPVAIEPFVSLQTQRTSWAAGYLLAAVLVAACAYVTFRYSVPVGPDETASANPPPSMRRRLQWLLLAFIPSGLMLAVTSHISTDIAAVPLLWIAPLALYLLSFVMAFSGAADRWIGPLRRLLPLVLIPLVATAALSGGGPSLVRGTLLAGSVAVISYGALFVLLGLWVRRALIWGLAYILLWEGFVAIAGDNAQRLAIRSYTRSLLSDTTGVNLFLADIAVAASVIVPLVVAVIAFLLTAWRLRKMEVA
jgi:hypothetical protein